MKNEHEIWVLLKEKYDIKPKVTLLEKQVDMSKNNIIAYEKAINEHKERIAKIDESIARIMD